MNLRPAFASLLGAAIGCSLPGPGVPGPVAPVTASDGRYAMGTVLEITLVGLDESDLRSTLDDLFDRARRLDGLMTRVDPDSALSRLNRNAGRGRLAVDPELAEILRLAIAYSSQTRVRSESLRGAGGRVYQCRMRVLDYIGPHIFDPANFRFGRFSDIGVS